MSVKYDSIFILFLFLLSLRQISVQTLLQTLWKQRANFVSCWSTKVYFILICPNDIGRRISKVTSCYFKHQVRNIVMVLTHAQRSLTFETSRYITKYFRALWKIIANLEKVFGNHWVTERLWKMVLVLSTVPVDGLVSLGNNSLRPRQNRRRSSAV